MLQVWVSHFTLLKSQKRIQATITYETDYIATDLASDKKAANRMLGDLGLPVLRQIAAITPQEAAKVAKRNGFPSI